MHVDDFPTEILVHIFQQAKSSAPFAVGGSTLTILISQVCRTWRSIALDSAALWNDLRITSGSSLFKLDQLFTRSKGSLISVTVDCRAPATPLAHYWKLLKSVTAHSAHIAALDFIAPLHVLSMLSRVVIGNHFPRLQRLHVVQASAPHVRPEDEINWRVPVWKMAVDCPHLRYLFIHALTPMSHEKLHFLRELHIKESGYFIRETPVDHLVELQTLSIASSPLPSSTDCPADSQIISLALADLRAIDIPRGTLTRFLSTLRMPALQYLAIEGLAGYLWDEFALWLADAQYPVLRSVALESVPLTGMDEQCLRAFSSVSTLRLTHVDPGPVVRILESNPRICPNLRAIDVGINGRLRIRTRR
ncbi:hypothetical protein B0H17DRAFT_1067552 [Mycena rosella]|uniref:F-box domain-containing protein n=1 Tax=Mycena rosella TaxID=1033263 RepID=A0AAD7DDF1_MYCRO|nr:hypothetical protein B0H17DRAFT_1067552 [Mycena rosella]